jgi:hypothetical protein
MDCLYSMIEANILRHFAPVDMRLSQQDDIPPTLELRWPHLSLVYQILSRFLALTPKFERHQKFAELLLPIADSPDPNERAVIGAFYEQLIRAIANMRQSLTSLFARYIKTHVHGTSNGAFLVSTVLGVFIYMMNEVSGVPDSRTLFLGVILPLFSHPLSAMFQPQMTVLVKLFLDVDKSLAFVLTKYILSEWPWAVANKQVFFLESVLAALPKTPQSSIEALARDTHRVFRALGETVSQNVGNALASFWARPSAEQLSAMHGRVLIPIPAGPIANLAENHWWPRVKQNAKIAISVLQRRNNQAVEQALRSEEQGAPPQVTRWVAMINTAHDLEESILVRDYLSRVAKISQQNLPRPDVSLPTFAIDRRRSNLFSD